MKKKPLGSYYAAFRLPNGDFVFREVDLPKFLKRLVSK